MKKTLAYTVIAILLGAIVMLFPVAMLAPSKIYTTFGAAPPPPAPAAEAYKAVVEEAVEELQRAEGVAIFPSSLLNAGLIFTLGFVVALGTSQYYKKKIVFLE